MKLYELIEGRNDPHTHKAIFMLGGPGSGKTHVSKKLAGGTGLRTVNVDEFYELLRDRQGIQGQGFDDDLYKYSGNLTQKKLDLLLGGRIGLIIDGTGRKIERLTEIKNDLEKMGYDTMAVFVNTELNKALDRNEERRRKADSGWVRKVHAELKSKLGSLQSIFHNMLIVDNSEDGNDFTDAQKVVTKFLNAPNARPVDWPVNEDDEDGVANVSMSPQEIAAISAKTKNVGATGELKGQDAEDIDSWKEVTSTLTGGDNAAYYKRVTMKIMRDAKDFIGESGQPLKLAYRGYERFENFPFHRPYRTNRKPKDSSNTDQQIYNSAIRSAGGTADRTNSIFVSGNFTQAKKYGSVYVVFPIGDFNYTYHDTTADWYDQYGSRPQGVMKEFLELTDGKLNDPIQVAYNIIRKSKELEIGQNLAAFAEVYVEMVDGIHADENLRGGLGKGVEILLSAKGGYYYVPEHYFFKYVRRYMEMNGIQVEDKPAPTF